VDRRVQDNTEEHIILTEEIRLRKWIEQTKQQGEVQEALFGKIDHDEVQALRLLCDSNPLGLYRIGMSYQKASAKLRRATSAKMVTRRKRAREKDAEDAAANPSQRARVVLRAATFDTALRLSKSLHTPISAHISTLKGKTYLLSVAISSGKAFDRSSCSCINNLAKRPDTYLNPTKTDYSKSCTT
jgi:hypothetical protein